MQAKFSPPVAEELSVGKGKLGDMQAVVERVVGVFFGLAAGDRIGGPVRMALRVAESLRDRAGFDSSDIARRYLEWWREGAFDAGPTEQVLSLMASGVPREGASIQADEEAGGMTAGCNPAHRVAPLAMCAFVTDPDVDIAARSEARLTHRHPVSGDVAGAVACLCRALIRGAPWSTALKLAANERYPETLDALAIRPVGQLSPDGFASDALAAAVHFVDCAESFPLALGRSIEFAGPATYCPVLVGSIGGARWGRAQVDRELPGHHSGLMPRLYSVAMALAEGWQREMSHACGA